ncbi:MAG: NADP oxidoreductase [Omnitrophica WOR_2 bacterium RIFCSPHIGHO2_02_FULL_52_10]|nr:MAG: NADP oxidoreductase [Omnitrophica WOR_2 bacterium RIFCSPHIGHO2_02_FULL_52_10]
MPVQLGTNERPLRVAIVGSGPSGFYAAGALLKAPVKVAVDMFDRLPVPYGLVRYGVAPDHPKIKNVTSVYKKTAELEGFSFLGNVNVGTDIEVSELKKYYDAVLFACGAETDRKLGIPGEDLKGSHTATEFVAWYNGHPDYRGRAFDLSGKSAVIIGQGNVAMDVCRILSKTVDELKATDIACHALEALAESNIKEIHLIGRRGPVQAAFTPVEIREFGELADCHPVVDPKDLEVNQASQAELDAPDNAQRRKNYEILKSLSAMQPGNKRKRLIVHFLKSPVELVGDKGVQKVILEKNKLTGEAGKQKSAGTGEKEELKCDILFRSVGYRGIPIKGVPFHESSGVFPNDKGRITENGQVVPGLYTTGWIKRGPSGVIGTNKPDSEETVASLLADAGTLTPCAQPDTRALTKILNAKGKRVVTFQDWLKIDAAEIQRGQKAGKPREKFVAVEEMISIL